MKPLHVANDNFTNRTCKVWKPRLGRELTCEDARQIAANVTGFFSILDEWLRAEIASPANDTTEEPASHVGEDEP